MDELLFKNTSKLDDEEISSFQNLSMKKMVLVTSLVFTALFAAVGIGLSFVNVTIGVALIVCGVLGGFVLLPYLMKESVKKQNKEILGNKKYLNTYEFYENYFVVTSQSSEKDKEEYEVSASQKIYYKDLNKVVTYSDKMFIFINAKQSLILDYRKMTKGTAGELVELFKKNNIKIVNKKDVA